MSAHNSTWERTEEQETSGGEEEGNKKKVAKGTLSKAKNIEKMEI